MSEPGAIKYQAVVDLAQRNNSHTMLHELATEGRRTKLRILEVGCATGYLGGSLVAHGHHVVGVEPDAASAELAARALDEVWNGGLHDYLATHPEARFDVLLFGDVLEHLVDPADALRRAMPHLRDGGTVVVSLPNIAHGSVRAMLLEGRFDYEDRGILDRTHLRFFTRDGIARLFAETGLQIERLLEVGEPIPSVDREYGMRLRPELVTAVELLDDGDTRHAFQYVLRASPSSLTRTALLEANLSVPVESAAQHPHAHGSNSWKQKLQVKLFRALLRSISERRFRG
jgi:2-polyprenyl-3-methyl-5-hydroxy-6-metoxy-1,4-benzoquinol methylase